MLDVSVAFGRVLLRLRKERGLSQEALAGDAGLPTEIYKPSGKGRIPTKISTVFELAEALGCAPSTFIAYVEEEINRQ